MSGICLKELVGLVFQHVQEIVVAFLQLLQRYQVEILGEPAEQSHFLLVPGGPVSFRLKRRQRSCKFSKVDCQSPR